MMTAAERVSRAKAGLILDHPFFGLPAARLTYEASPTCDTARTNGTRVQYDPAYVDSITDAQLKGLIAHEVLHCMLGHCYRANGRDLKTWNDACDYAVNPVILAAGMQLPGEPLVDARFDGMAAEQIYAILRRQQQDDPQQAQQPRAQQPRAQQPGGIEPGTGPAPGTEPGEGAGELTEADWQIIAAQAEMVCKRGGTLPGAGADALHKRPVNAGDVRQAIKDFVSHVVPSDYSWARPARRLMAHGIYLPGITRENLGQLVFAIDTSGSMSQAVLSICLAVINDINQEMHPEAVHVIQCDTRIHSTETFTDDEEIKLTAKGRGGTKFAPVFEAIEEMEEAPACLIYLTDLENSDPGQFSEPAYPVLWVTTEATTLQGPFGQTLQVSEAA